MTAVRRFFAILTIEWRHILRDRTTRALLVAVPAFQLVLFATTINLDPRDVTLAIAGISGEEAKRLRALVEASQHFRIVADDLASGEAERRLDRGEVLVAIEGTPRAEGDEGLPPPPRLLVDAADPAATATAIAALERAFLRSIVDRVRLSGAPSIDIEWRYNSERRTAWAIVPGLSGAVVMISMLMLGALCLVREREQGTWEQLLSSPIRTLEALAGKLLPYLAVGLAQTAIVITMAHVLFGLPVRGSALMLMIGSGLTAACYLAIGFAISARVDTSMQAIQVAVFLYLPSMVLSGFMFPFNGMPRWAQLAGELVPLTHFVRIARDTVLRDAPTIRTAPDLVWLGGLAVALIAAAVILYRNRPE